MAKSAFSMPRGRKTKGRVSRADNASLARRGARGIRVLAKSLAGEPRAKMRLPGQAEGRRGGVRIMAKEDPNLGGKYVEKDARTITSTKTDIGAPGGYRGAKIVAKDTFPQKANKGSTVVRPPRVLRGLRKR